MFPVQQNQESKEESEEKIMVNQMYLDKANVLIEALPYIQRFNRKIIVIKYGGSAMVDEELKRNVIQEPKFVNGLRVTDADTMEVAEMVLNKVNKELVTMIQSLGVNAVGISGKDGGLLNVEKKLSKGEDIGFVGNIKNVNPKVLYDLLENDFLPVVCPVGMDDDFNTYNINADDAACAIAEALNAEKLAFLTDIEGVYKDPKDPSTLISELPISEAKKLIEEAEQAGYRLWTNSEYSGGWSGVNNAELFFEIVNTNISGPDKESLGYLYWRKGYKAIIGSDDFYEFMKKDSKDIR